jgi:hypothetical protein
VISTAGFGAQSNLNGFEQKESLMRQLQLIAHGEPSNVIEINTVSEPALGQEFASDDR